MGKNRLEAFSDGVLAIIITIMVLELKVPHGEQLDVLLPLLPAFLSYVLSFVYIGIYWNNHHHMLHAATKVSGPMLWANLHLLFWLSLFPFVTGWMGENHFAAVPTALYGLVLLMAAILLLLVATVGALGIAWRLLQSNDRLRVKMDWLRSNAERMQAELKSYESVTPADRKRTTVMPTGMAGTLSAKRKA